MNQTIERDCRCAPCAGASCTCGCQAATAPSACGAGCQCGCAGDARACTCGTRQG